MKTDYPVAFDECWREFPRRSPDNPKKPAFKCWLARVREGIPISDLLEATKGYAVSCRQRRIEGSDKVMMGQTFYGPNERYVAFVPSKEMPVLAQTRREIPRSEEVRPDPAMAKEFIRGLLEKLAHSKTSPVIGLREQK